MRLLVLEDSKAVSAEALSILQKQLAEKPDSAIGYPTGASVTELYAMMREASLNGELDLSPTSAFQLDDYLGLPITHPQRFAHMLDEQVFQTCGVSESRIHLFGENPAFSDADGIAYDRAIQHAGGLDLLLLGIGANGHVGFNEPGSDFAAGTHRVGLTDEMRKSAAPSFKNPDEVPHFAATMGIGSILAAKKLVLLAMGEGKASAITSMLTQPASPDCPASALTAHADLTVLLDRKAASRLTEQQISEIGGAR